MSHRRTVHIPGHEHGNPVPAAARVGPLLMTGKIVGKDPATGRLGAALAEQCAHMFHHVRAIAEAAGGSTDHII